MDNKILVTLVVAIYKSENFLHKLLDSICNQTYKNLEIILVDDGSPDNSGDICDAYANQDNRIHVIHQKNQGACAARNAGIDKASGEYILIIDGDDWLEEDYVEYLLNLAVSTGSDMAMTDKIFTTIDRTQIRNDYSEIWTPERASAAIVYPEIPIGPWNKLYSMKVLNAHNLRFTTKWSGEGLYFSFMAAQLSNQVAVGHKKIYNYRLNNLNSGLTNYKLEMGTNALENIHYIKEVSIIRTEYMMHAIDWHIWKNNYFVLYLIIATNSVEENRALYSACANYLRKNLIGTVLKSKVSPKEKVKMILKSISPWLYANYEIKKKERQLKFDKME